MYDTVVSDVRYNNCYVQDQVASSYLDRWAVIRQSKRENDLIGSLLDDQHTIAVYVLTT